MRLAVTMRPAFENERSLLALEACNTTKNTQYFSACELHKGTVPYMHKLVGITIKPNLENEHSLLALETYNTTKDIQYFPSFQLHISHKGTLVYMHSQLYSPTHLCC